MLPATKLRVSNIIMSPSNMLQVLQHLEDYYHKNMVVRPKSTKQRATTAAATKLRVSNIAMSPSNMLQVLQHLEDYYHKNMTRVPLNGEEWPGPNLFHKDIFNFKTLQAVWTNQHRLPDILTCIKNPITNMSEGYVNHLSNFFPVFI